MFKSKIVWTQILGTAASFMAAWGLDVSADNLVAIVLGVQAAQSVVTAIMRKFFTVKAAI